MPLAKGQVLNDRFRIVTLLAQGGFGAVYRAWDLNLKNAVALKENLTITPESLKQFTVEARLLANLRQENLPYVIDYFSLPGQGQYLVMEFVEGQDLQSMLDETGRPLPKTQSINWITQICNALIYLHSQTPPVIHRDIKPANIKITPKGQVMLVDFGIAKIFDPSHKTTVGARAVTQGFSPPEQYGSGRTDARSDIYAMGATLYACLTAQVPLDSLQRRMGVALPRPSQFNPGISTAVEEVILRAMELEPARRFQSAHELKNALTNSLINPSVVINGIVHRAGPPAPQIPATQVAPSMAENIPAPAYAGPRQSPAANLPAANLPPSYTPAARALPAERRTPGSSPAYPAGRATSAPRRNLLLVAGTIIILLLGVLAVLAGAAYYFSLPLATATKTPKEESLVEATGPEKVAPSHTATTPPTHTPPASLTWTVPPAPSFTPSPSPVPSWTPIPSRTPTSTQNPLATWYPCAGTYPSRLRVGGQAYISFDPPLPNRVRSHPDTGAEVLGYLQVGEKMEILEGPVCFGGWIWWRVHSLDTSLSGWTAEGDESSYWLVPIP